MVDKVKKILALIMFTGLFLVLIMSTGCLSENQDSGTDSSIKRPSRTPQDNADTTESGGKKGPVKGENTMQVARPNDPERDECKDACDDECSKKMSNCEKACENKYENVCEDASNLLAGCNLACQFLPIPPGPGPNPRADCFDKCLVEFKKVCSSSDLEDCVEKCPSNYQTCQKSCYGNC